MAFCFFSSIIAESAASHESKNCQSVIAALTEADVAVASLIRLARSYHDRPETEIQIYKRILTEYADISQDRRLEVLIELGSALIKTRYFAEAESTLDEAREIASTEFPNRLMQVYLKSHLLYTKWGAAQSEAFNEMTPAYFTLAQVALDHADQYVSSEDQRELIATARDELRRAIDKGIQLPSGGVALAVDVSRRQITEAQKQERLALSTKMDSLVRQAESWLWSYYENHALSVGILDSRSSFNRAVSILKRVYLLNGSKARNQLYLKLRSIQTDLRGKGIPKSVAEHRAIKVIEESLFLPWRTHLMDFIILIRNNEGQYAESFLLEHAPVLFEILIEVPNRIRSGREGMGQPGSAPITAGQMYEYLLKSIDGWAPHSDSLVALKRTWQERINHELLKVAEYRADLRSISKASQ